MLGFPPNRPFLVLAGARALYATRKPVFPWVG